VPTASVKAARIVIAYLMRHLPVDAYPLKPRARMQAA
jgi:hypothetical protein